MRARWGGGGFGEKSLLLLVIQYIQENIRNSERLGWAFQVSLAM